MVNNSGSKFDVAANGSEVLRVINSKTFETQTGISTRNHEYARGGVVEGYNINEVEVKPGCADYAMMIGDYRFRVNRMVSRGRYRWVMRLLPTDIPTCEDIRVPHAAVKSFLQAKNGDMFAFAGHTEHL